MKTAFSRYADFSNITGISNLYISDILHEATLEITEAGLSAAAATGIVFNLKSFPPKEEPIQFLANRPFSYLLLDQDTNVITFIGKCDTPTTGNKKPPLHFELASYGSSDIGLVRENNEDVWSSLPEHGFFVLADGLGGCNAGEIAAKEAASFMCTSIEEIFSNKSDSLDTPELARLKKLIMENANRYVHEHSHKKPEYSGMGTTLCSLLFHEKSLIYGHVGDSRIYRLRDNHLEQLTHDHSLENQMIAEGRYTKSDESPFPYQHVVTRTIGTHQEVTAEVNSTPLRTDDVYLMCSDGLTDYVSNEEISTILKDAYSPEQATKNLIERAKLRCSEDNITAVVIRVR